MTAISPEDTAATVPAVVARGFVRDAVRRHPTVVLGGAILVAVALMALMAPYLGTVDPQALSPVRRLKPPSAQYWFGTDMLGRDLYSRTIFGARVSLVVGFGVALASTAAGLAIGLVTGFSRWA